MKRYKACRDSIVTLKLLPDSITNENRNDIVDEKYAKFRTNKALVVSIYDIDLNEEICEDKSLFDKYFIYQVGKIIETEYDYDISLVCGKGIHYYNEFKMLTNFSGHTFSIISPYFFR